MITRLLFVALALLPLAAGAQAYRWVDDKGQVHYSQIPPPGRNAEPVGPAPPPATAPNQESLNRSLAGEKEAEPGKRAEAERMDQARKQREQQCSQAREQLAYMEAKTARRLGTTDEQGNVSRVTEEQFQARRTELQQAISEHCG
jgi:hypothetical protein